MTENRTRTKAVLVRMLDAERAEIEALAEHWRLSMNDVMRRAVREAFEREGLGRKSGRAKR